MSDSVVGRMEDQITNQFTDIKARGGQMGGSYLFPVFTSALKQEVEQFWFHALESAVSLVNKVALSQEILLDFWLTLLHTVPSSVYGLCNTFVIPRLVAFCVDLRRLRIVWIFNGGK